MSLGPTFRPISALIPQPTAAIPTIPGFSADFSAADAAYLGGLGTPGMDHTESSPSSTTDVGPNPTDISGFMGDLGISPADFGSLASTLAGNIAGLVGGPIGSAAVSGITGLGQMADVNAGLESIGFSDAGLSTMQGLAAGVASSPLGHVGLGNSISSSLQANIEAAIEGLEPEHAMQLAEDITNGLMLGEIIGADHSGKGVDSGPAALGDTGLGGFSTETGGYAPGGDAAGGGVGSGSAGGGMGGGVGSGESSSSDGWFRGGYTGGGADGVVQPREVAGPVHEGEQVLNAAATRYYGADLLGLLNNQQIPRSALMALVRN